MDRTIEDNNSGKEIHEYSEKSNFNSEYAIDKAAEKKLVRKLDLLLVPVIFLLYLLCFIDRTNIGNARIAGLEKDLGLKGFEYNIALTVFYIAYIISEIPSQIAMKLIGARIWIAFLVFGFGLITMCTAFIHNFGALLAVRIFLGFFEGGVMPACAYLLSRFYTRAELVFRISIFVSASTLAGAVGGLMASGFLAAGKVTSSLGTWRNIFFFEGIISMAVAGIAYLILSDSPETSRWLNESERKLASARVRAETAGSKVVVEKYKNSEVLRAMSNGFVLTMGVAFTAINISVQGLSLFTPTVIRTIYPGLTTVQQQLRTVPPYIVGFVVAIGTSYLVDHFDRRVYVMIPLVVVGIIGFAIFAATEVANTQARFASIFLGILGIFPQGPLVLAWGANNVAPDTARGVAIATIVSVGTLGAIVPTWSFLPGFAPTYHKAAYINLGSTSLTLLLYIGAFIYCLRENRLRKAGKRDHRLEGLTEQEISVMGSRHPKYLYSI